MELIVPSFLQESDSTFIKEQKINPPIAQVFPLEEINRAHELMETNHAGGKIVVEVC